MTDEYKTYKLGDFKLKSGETIPDAHIAFLEIGDPDKPAIIYPTWYSGCKLSFTRISGARHVMPLSPE